MKPGTEIHIAGHESVLNGLNGLILADDPESDEIWFVTLQGNRSSIVPDGSRHTLPREFVHEGLLPKAAA